MKNLDSEFQRYLRTELEKTEEQIEAATADELLDEVLAYEGHGQFAGSAIRNWVKHIYRLALSGRSCDIWEAEYVQR